MVAHLTHIIQIHVCIATRNGPGGNERTIAKKESDASITNKSQSQGAWGGKGLDDYMLPYGCGASKA